jgi:hypothetical protein
MATDRSMAVEWRFCRIAESMLGSKLLPGLGSAWASIRVNGRGGRGFSNTGGIGFTRGHTLAHHPPVQTMEGTIRSVRTWHPLR